MLTGLEALARWQRSDGSVLTPWQFLKDVQNDGLSQKLTDAMIDRAIGQLCQWDRAGVRLPRVSVNLGAEDLADPSLVDRVNWALDRHSMPAARLGLEVLETVVADTDPDGMVSRNLLALGALGCHIDLDDFGTGSASINGIRRFGVHRIKIDRSLITAVDTDPDQHAMIAAILTMAQQMGVDVLAEGVETPGEFSALAQLGCAHVQGYAIARPMPGPDLLAWVLRRAERDMPEFPGGIPVKAAETLRRDAPPGQMGGKTA
jgi:EAL domain-containing protein (putative c-di-GMP-specific phosphodiesterase class I)